MNEDLILSITVGITLAVCAVACITSGLRRLRQEETLLGQ